MIAVYSGFESAVIRELESALKRLKIDYKKIKSSDIHTNMLEDFSILLIPGGFTLSLIKSIKSSIQNIRNFVKSGGNYVGICAGALIAPKDVVIDYTDEKLFGLGIIDIKNEKEIRRIGEEREIIIREEHQIVMGCPKKLKTYFLNGPMIIPKSRKIKILAIYENGFGALVHSKFGKGNVILFSFHPEKLLSTLPLLKNAIEFCDKNEREKR